MDPAVVGGLSTVAAAAIAGAAAYLTRSKSKTDPVATLVDAYAAADARADRAERELVLLRDKLAALTRPVSLERVKPDERGPDDYA